jgi:hypothetical protein
VNQVPPPPQLSFNFNLPPVIDARTEEVSPRSVRAAVSIGPSCVLDISPAISRKQEAHTQLLYRQILDSVKHLGR